jgi:EmrB/QacA subfamily drug resistance transporter
MGSQASRRWWALGLICLVQFMTILDIAIVNVALPSIQADLHFSRENLQWVISAYALFFGGFLLLGGRLGDRLGRRRMFMVGLALFTVASLCAGLSWSEASLIVARCAQGLGAAMLSPAALAIITATFAEGRDRNIALGVWGATGGFGAAAGVLLGGILTELLSWQWIFFVNVPVGAVALVLTPFWVDESRDLRTKTFDAVGAVLITSGLVVLVYGITQANTWGWGSARTWLVFAGSAVLQGLFLLWERGREEPLVPMSIFRVKTVLGANITGFILGTILFAMFLLLTLYMQQVLGMSPLRTGLGYLAVAGTAILWANVAALLVNRVGVKPILMVGMALMGVGLVFFTQISADGSYWSDLFPGFLIIGLGMPFVFVPVTIAAVAGVSHDEAGLASGLINTSQQIGGALGIAVLAAVANHVTTSQAADGTAAAQAAVDGFTAAFWVAAAAAAVGVAAIAVFVRRSELVTGSAPEPEGEPATATV